MNKNKITDPDVSDRSSTAKRNQNLSGRKMENRIAKLTAVIDQLYGKVGPDEVDKISLGYDWDVAKMVEVEKIKERTVNLKDIFDDTIYEPVVFPEGIISYLKRRDVFLTTLGHRNDKWHVLYLSPPYQTG